ncbi:hypothetical protein C8J57DRAFT_1223693 [Mycena rebaudengoi]|nr:hypothetical protein C8J57DRAFT_1223693 [Mycena rebaudengoi]
MYRRRRATRAPVDTLPRMLSNVNMSAQRNAHLDMSETPEQSIVAAVVVHRPHFAVQQQDKVRRGGGEENKSALCLCRCRKGAWPILRLDPAAAVPSTGSPTTAAYTAAAAFPAARADAEGRRTKIRGRSIQELVVPRSGQRLVRVAHRLDGLRTSSWSVYIGAKLAPALESNKVTTKENQKIYHAVLVQYDKSFRNHGLEILAARTQSLMRYPDIYDEIMQVQA